MSVIESKKGLDVPMAGGLASTEIADGPKIGRVALKPTEAPGIKTQVLVKPGDTVKCGQPLFVDRRDPEVLFTSPAGGTVEAINRGEKRKVLSVVVKVADREESVDLPKVDPSNATREQIQSLLLASGLWPCLRQRPYDRVAVLGTRPAALFVTAAESSPLAPSPSSVLRGRENLFTTGLNALSKLVDGKTYLCTRRGDSSDAFRDGGKVEWHQFDGPHPAGTVGYHIHSLDPVGGEKVVWHIGYQDVAAFGEVLLHQRIPTERVIALVGTGFEKTALVRTRRGAMTEDLTEGSLRSGPTRVISGSAVSGTISNPATPDGAVGRYDNMVTAIPEESPRDFLGWMTPGANKYSLTNAFVGKLSCNPRLKKRKFFR